MLLFDQILEAMIIHKMSLVGNPGWNYNDDWPMKRAVPIKIDNIISNMDDVSIRKELEWHNIQPTPLPPFVFSFIEGNYKNTQERFGIHVSCSSQKHGIKQIINWIKNGTWSVPKDNYDFSKLDNTAYVLHFSFFQNERKDIVTFTPTYTVFLDKNGNVILVSDQTIGVWHKTKYENDTNYEERKFALMLKVKLCLFIFSLMNCKNIIVEKEDAPKEEQIKRIKKIGMPLVTYRVIKINQTLIKRENQVKKTDNEPCMPLHICRGNFATYEEDKPLFGRYVGTFWRPQHIKGKERFGKIIKEYHV